MPAIGVLKLASRSWTGLAFRQNTDKDRVEPLDKILVRKVIGILESVKHVLANLIDQFGWRRRSPWLSLGVALPDQRQVVEQLSQMLRLRAEVGSDPENQLPQWGPSWLSNEFRQIGLVDVHAEGAADGFTIDQITQDSTYVPAQ